MKLLILKTLSWAVCFMFSFTSFASESNPLFQSTVSSENIQSSCLTSTIFAPPVTQCAEAILPYVTGLVSISGGGGANIVPEIDLDYLLKDMPRMGVAMVVPSEDDGGSSAKIIHHYQKEYNLYLPAMGDTMNAFAGLSNRRNNRDGTPLFLFIRDMLQ